MANTLGVNIDPNAVLSQLEKEQETYIPKKKTEFSTKNYLQARLGENETSKTMVIRLLPFSPEGGTPFYKVLVHTVKVDKEVSPGGWRMFVCPAHNTIEGKQKETCPFCETSAKAREKMREATTEVEKKKFGDIEFMNRAKEAWVVRVIERGHEEDGVKFWLFNNSRKKDGPYDKIMNLYKNRWAAGIAKGKENNIFDVNDGKDLILNLSKDTNGKTVIQVTDDDERSPLSDDLDKAKAWIEDKRTWSDVFTTKPYEYTSIIVCGGVPVWSKEKQGWVEKTQMDKYKKEVEEMELQENLTHQSKDFSKFVDENETKEDNDVKWYK